MKKLLNYVLVVTFLSVLFVSCEKKEDVKNPPELPPYESLAIDFETFGAQKSTNDVNSNVNIASAGVTVFVWNVMLTVTLVVPVAAFYGTINQEAEFIGDNTWQWVATVNAAGGTYESRLTGKLAGETVEWKMYVSKTGVGAFEDFLWFEGISAIAATNGQWILYHSPAVAEAVLQIDWEKTGEEIGEIKYTYIRVSDNGDVNQLAKDSYLQYGLTEAAYNAFYTVHAVKRTELANGFNDVFIEWNTTDKSGRIKALPYFHDSEWHCWDSMGLDVVCGE